MASSLDPANVAAVFKAYDIRGAVPGQLDESLARAVGRAFVQVLRRSGATADRIVVGHDMRPSSPALARAYAEGVNESGADVIMIGLSSTDQLYFASGHLGLPGAMFTASHNPARDNGIKQCLGHAAPVGADSGLDEIRDLVLQGAPTATERPGTVEELDILGAYVDHLLALAPVSGRRLTVVVDAGNGMAGHTAPAVFAKLPDVELVPMYFELDGTFPNHEANPIDPANLVDLQGRVRETQADVGLAFDGDADRCFLVDERGRLVTPSALTALIAARELAASPGSVVIHNLVTSRAVPEIVRELGGTPVRTRVGHTFIKTRMAETDAVFGGEHSGHFYFRDFWRADSGMLAALHALAALSESDVALSDLLAPYERYPLSGEINSIVDDKQAVLDEVERAFAGRDGAVLDRLDGLTVSTPEWSINVRPSNTESLLRLNVEGKDNPTMQRLRDEALAIIRKET